jgi:hypothetical protein
MIATWSANPNVTVAADMRAWGQGISNALQTFGWVKTADTGQLDWTTSGSVGQNTVLGYEVFRMNDALQATAPVFLRLQYGSNVNTQPRIVWQVGTGTNGAGTITGTATAAPSQALEMGGSSTTQAYTSYASGASDRFALALNAHNTGDPTTQTSSALGMALSIERTKDANGNNTAEGVCVYAHGQNLNTNNYEQTLSFVAGIASSASVVQPYALAGVASAIYQLDVSVFPHYPFLGKLLPAKTDLLSYMTADIAPLSQFQATIAGTARNYLALGTRTNVPTAGYQPGRNPAASTTAVGVAMRYD